MANTLTNMQGRTMAEAAIVEANGILTNIAAFSTGLNKEAGQKGDTVRVPIISAVEAADFDSVSNNYAAGVHTDEGVDVPVNKHKVAKAAYSDIEFSESPVDFWEKKGISCGRGLAKAVVKETFALINGTFLKKADVALAEFNKKYVTTLVTLAEDNDIDPAEATLTLQGVYFSALLAELDSNVYGGNDAIQSGKIPNLFGFGQIVRAPLLKSANPELAGFISLPQSIGIGFRYLQPQSAKVYEETGMAYDDASGVLFGIRRFGEPSTGNNHLAYEALYGSKALDRKALIRLIAA